MPKSLLKALIRRGRSGLRKTDAAFALQLIKDAEKLDWAESQLEKRKRAIRSVIMGSISGFAGLERSDLLEPSDGEIDLLEKKGWNKVDSGFRLWGGGLGHEGAVSQDEFLASKGWNDVDSGFRLL